MKPFEPFVPYYTKSYEKSVREYINKVLADPTNEHFAYVADKAKERLAKMDSLYEIHKWIIDNLDKAEVIDEDNYQIPIKYVYGNSQIGYKVADTYLAVSRYKENNFIGESAHLNGSWECRVYIKGICGTFETSHDTRWTLEVLNNQDKVDELCKIRNECVNKIRF